MRYYKGAIYIWNQINIFKYELGTSKCIRTKLSGINFRNFGLNSICMYKDSIFSLFGWDYDMDKPIKEIIRVNISDDQYSTDIIPIDKYDIAEWSMGYLCKDNLVYLFGGGSETGNQNSLATINLDATELGVSALSKNNLFPIAKGGHGMEVYNDELYLLGGEDSQGSL